MGFNRHDCYSEVKERKGANRRMKTDLQRKYSNIEIHANERKQASQQFKMIHMNTDVNNKHNS